ncbi:MAG: hypothetical protein HDS16_00535 [Bacteroides sp.]|nr:hypothetical protein [Bacteroidales bacterium]MBD5301481.1 hypothetical protein [Bacteroides sp.]MBD5349030.1 hypothetical protein [Bacteroides sp.]
MKKNSVYQLGFILSILSLALTFKIYSFEVDRPFKYLNEEYDFFELPPADADTSVLTLVYYRWLPSFPDQGDDRGKDFVIGTTPVTIAEAGENIYFNILVLNSHGLNSPGGEPNVQSWVKGIRENNLIRFPNKRDIGQVTYDLMYSNYYVWRDTLFNVCDTIKSYTISVDSEELSQWYQTHGGDIVDSDCEKYWKISYLDDDIEVQYDPQRRLIWKPNHHMFFKSDYGRKYYYLSEDKGETHSFCQGNYIRTRAMRDQMVMKDFIIGERSDDEIEELPIPEVSLRKYDDPQVFMSLYNYHKFSYPELNIYLDIVNEEGKLIDFEGIHTVIYRNGRILRDLTSLDGFSPFKNSPRYINLDPCVWNDEAEYEVMFYYDRSDGTRIESPRIKACNYENLPEGFKSCVFSNVKYDWDLTPPETAQRDTLSCILDYWMPDYETAETDGFKVSIADVEVAKDRRNLYYKLAFLKENSVNVTDTVKTWIKGVQIDNTLRFYNNSQLGSVKYNMQGFKSYCDPAITDRRTICDTISLRSVAFGCDTVASTYACIHEGPIPSQKWERMWRYEFRDEDVSAQFNPETGLVHGLDHHLLIKSNYDNKYHPYHIIKVKEEPVISSNDFRDEMGIRDLIIGRKLTGRLQTLPAPLVQGEKRIMGDTVANSPENALAESDVICHVVYPLISDDGYLIDPMRIHTVYYRDAEVLADYVSFDGFSPFAANPKEINMGLYDKDSKYEVMSYYEYDDGTRIESPRVIVFNPVEVKPIVDEGDIQAETEGKVYDLTGREVESDHLLPGIYIRNRRKFVVR